MHPSIASLHNPHLHSEENIRPKRFTQLLQYILVTIESCKQNWSKAILKVEEWTVYQIIYEVAS